MSNSPVVLVSTLHDPDGEQGALARPFVSNWANRYRELVLLASPTTSQETISLLEAEGARVLVDRAPQGVDALGRIRLHALLAAGTHPHILLIDFDRLVHWESHFPRELQRVERKIPEHDLLVLGRSQRAFESHPLAQRETERVANEAFAAAAGKRWDITGGARGFSQQAIQALAHYSRCAHVGVDAEWPILCERLALRVGYLQTEGLEFETADRYQPLIAEIGYQAWLDRYVNTPPNWEQRLRFAYQIAVAARDGISRPLLESNCRTI